MNQEVRQDKLIDIEKVFASKNKRLAKALPKFFFSYLKKIVHQDQLNADIYRNSHLEGLPFVSSILKDFGISTEIKDAENLPKDGRYIIVANHPLGGPDGLALMNEIGKIRPDIVFPVNDLLLNVNSLKPLFIPVNKHGKNTENIRKFDEAFESDNLILYFPAGLVSRKNNNVIRDLEWKTTFLNRARKYNRDIIPVHISGKNSKFFYRLAKVRKFFGIKANLEMLYLVDELYKHTGKPIRVTVGKPIPLSTFNKSKKPLEWAQVVKEQVYAIGENKELPIQV